MRETCGVKPMPPPANPLASNGTHRRDLSTTQAAILCGVSPRTIVKWCDAGMLPSHRVPGGRFRRIYPEDFEAFCVANGMARVVAAIRGVRGCYVLCVGLGADAAAALDARLPEGWRLEVAATVWQAATAFHRSLPVAVVLDGSVGRGQAWEIATAMLAARPRPRVVVVVPADCEPGAYLPGLSVVEVPGDVPPHDLAGRLTGQEKGGTE